MTNNKAKLTKLFGSEVSEKIHGAKVLLVGAGGIGCELLKDLILMEIGEIHVLDLDTIDLSNLNRQFLFRHKDIKQSKSLTAVKAVEHFNLKSKLVAYHGNIMDINSYPIEFFGQFDIIYNALDNLEARIYVNKMALFNKVALYESGTTGFKGQVQPIYPYLSECFHCMPKEPPKTFPVCTIRSTPYKPIHSITWSKNFLLPQLFGEGSGEDNVKAADFNSEEEAKVKMKESNELNDIKELILKNKNLDLKVVYKILEKIYQLDIENLIKIDTLWKTRAKPTILPNLDTLIDLKLEKDYYMDKEFDLNKIHELVQQIEMFIKSAINLTIRLQKGEIIEFDKDDKDTLEFVVSSSNIRSHLFHIPLKTEFQIKEIAGNIIPAVATTNAIMAGFSALTSVQYFLNDKNEERVAKSKMIYDSTSDDKIINSTKLIKPNSNCKSCSITRGILKLNLQSLKVDELREKLIDTYSYNDDIEIICVNESGSKLIYDFDFEDNLNRNIGLMVKNGDLLQIGDSEDTYDLIELYVKNDATSDEIELPDIIIPVKKNAEEEEEEKDEDLVTENVGVESLDGVVLLEEEEEEEEEEEKSTNKRALEGSKNDVYNNKRIKVL